MEGQSDEVVHAATAPLGEEDNATQAGAPGPTTDDAAPGAEAGGDAPPPGGAEDAGDETGAPKPG